MKYIVAARRSKRAVLRMAALTAIISACTALAAPWSFAEEGADRWVSPDGLFAITVPAGWQRIDRYVDASHLLVVGPPAEIARAEHRELAICTVERGSVDAHGATQTDINESLRTTLAPYLDSLHPVRVYESTDDLVDGIRVISVDMDRRGARAIGRYMRSTFIVSTPSGALQYAIGCGASGSAYVDADVAAMHAFMSSFAFNTGTPQ